MQIPSLSLNELFLYEIKKRKSVTNKLKEVPKELRQICFSLNLSEKEIPYTYRLVEEGHHFQKEGDKYFRVSKIYREIIDRETGNILAKELILDNHSEVMYDFNLIPKDLIL